jgi:hypothetical protein
MTTVRAASPDKRRQITKQVSLLLALHLGLGLSVQAAKADPSVPATSSTVDSAPAVTPAPDPAAISPAPAPTPAATSAASPAGSPAASATPAPGASPASNSSASSGAPAAAASNDGPLVEPGPAEAKRTALVLRIFNAKAQGIGIDAYLNAFAMLENSVKTGETEANLNKRIDSLNSSLDDQLKRSAVLKTQRPAPPVAASGFPAGGLGSASSSSGGTSDLIRKLQEKYGDQIPPNLKDKLSGGQIPDNLKDKIPAGLGGLDQSQIEDLIKKYKK